MNAKKNSVTTTIAFCLGILLIALLVQIASSIKHDSLVFPNIYTICKACFRLLRTVQTYHLILTTLLHLIAAVGIATLMGVTLGILAGMSDFFRSCLQPLAMTLRSIPLIVLAVIIMVLIPYRFVPVITTAFILIPLISEATCEGFKSIDPALIDVYRLNSTMNFRILGTVYFPLMAGYLKQAYINAVGMGMKIIVTSEYLVQTRHSLGKAIFTSSYFSDYEDIYAYALIMILLVLLVSEIPLHLLQRKHHA